MTKVLGGGMMNAKTILSNDTLHNHTAVTMPKQHLLSKTFPNALHTLADKTKPNTCMIDIGVRKYTNTYSIHDKTTKYTKLPHEIKQQRHMVTSDNYTTSSRTSVVPNTLHESYKTLNPK
jgi:hypothetical protein